MNTPNLKSLILLTFGPVLSLVAFVIMFYFDPLNFSQFKSISALPAFLLSIVILVIHHSIRNLSHIDRTKTHSQQMYEAVRYNLHVTILGSADVALNYLTSRLPSLREVKNTSFNVEMEIERSNEKLYNSKNYIYLVDAIINFTSKDLLWKDIGDKYSIERFRKVYNQDQNSGNYKYRLINSSLPIINFILLEFHDGKREVLFNWDYRSRGQDPIVMVSRESQIVEMFTIQFAHLWESGSIDHDIVATKSTSKK